MGRLWSLEVKAIWIFNGEILLIYGVKTEWYLIIFWEYIRTWREKILNILFHE